MKGLHAAFGNYRSTRVYLLYWTDVRHNRDRRQREK